MRLVNFLLVGVVGLVLACRDEGSDAPRAPSSGGTAATGAGTDRDSGRPMPPIDSDGGNDEDGGVDAIDGGVNLNECRETPVLHLPNDELRDDAEVSTVSPADFEVSRLVGAWEGDCALPVFRVELSDGTCPDGDGHKLVFLIDGPALRDGNLRLGLNSVLPEPNDIGTRVRYTRPEGLEPAGEWGTCAEVEGTIDLVGDAPSVDALSELHAEFSLDLTACNEDTEAVQTVRGMFRVVLRRGLSDFCPEM